MELSTPSLSQLFEQLGLPSGDDEIEHFIERHRPLPDGVRLVDADFWTPPQAQFLREAVNVDAEWAEVFDQLNLRLHA